MNKNKYIFLFILCIVSMIGVLTQMQELNNTVAYNIEHKISPVISISKFPLFSIAIVTSIVSTIWGLIIAFRRRQWKWFISFLLLTYYSVGVYSLLNIIRLYKRTGHYEY